MGKEEGNKDMSSLLDLLSEERKLDKEIDSADEVTLEMCDAHFAKIKEIDSKVDRLLEYMDSCKMKSASLAERAKSLDEESKRWKKRLESLEQYALFLTTAFPDVKWRGNDRGFEKKLNPPSLVCSSKSTKSFSNYIPEALVQNVPAEFVEEVKIFLLKTDELKDSLVSGNTYDFAFIDRKEKLNIKPKERI